MVYRALILFTWLINIEESKTMNILSSIFIKNIKLLIKLSCFGQLFPSNPMPAYLFALLSSRLYLSQLLISFFAFGSCSCLLPGRVTERNETLLLYLNTLSLLLCWLYNWWKINLISLRNYKFIDGVVKSNIPVDKYYNYHRYYYYIE